MRRLRSLLLLMTLLVTSVGIVQGQDSNPALNITQYTLDNGLEVILVEDHSAPTVAVNVWYKVGGAHDPEGRSGFAHLFEHMMFEGSAHVEEGQLDQLTDSVGGRNNAYTSNEHTGYWMTLPAHYLPLGLWIEADRMASLRLNQTNFEAQRSVVTEEYNFRVSNSPYGVAIQELYVRPFAGYAPFERWVIGSVADLNAAELEDVKAFHATHYVPNNAVLTIAGDIDVEATREMIDTYFGQIPRQADPEALPEYEAADREAAERITVQDGLINSPALLIGYAIPPRNHPDFPALELLSRLLGSGSSSRLAQALIDTGMGLDAGSFTDARRGPSLFAAYVFPNMGVTMEEVEEIYNNEISRIAEEGVDPAELEKAINGILSERIVGLETVNGLAESVQAANFYFDDPNAVFGEIESFANVTVEDIQRVAAEYLSPNDQVVIEAVPGDVTPVTLEPAPSIASEDDEEELVYTVLLEQETPPEPLPITEFNLPNVTEHTLDNGLEVIVVEKPEIPIISLDLFLEGGDSATSAEQAGLGSLTALTLTRGTETRSAQEIASTLEQEGAFTGAEVTADALSVGVFALKEDIPLAFEMLGDIALNPTFPEGEVETSRVRLLTSLEQALSDSQELASRTFASVLYGDHPYGSIVTSESLENLTRDDVVNYYNSLLSPENAFLIVAGDITVDEALELAESTFGEWEAEGEVAEVVYADPPEQTETTIYLVDRPGSTQVDLVIGQLALEGDNPDRFAAVVLNDILSGGTTARLNANLREDKGYTYGVGSSFNFPVDVGRFVISSAVGNDVVEPALRELLGEIERIQAEPVTETELESAVNGLVGRYALNMETYQAFVNQIAAYKLRDLPLELLESYGTDIGAVDSEAVSNVAQQYLGDEPFVIVAVGDASVVQEALEAVGPVTLVEE